MNPLKHIRIFGSEFCPCGSGIKYQDCCKNKVVVPSQSSRKPAEVQIMEMMRKSIKRCCMHPDQSRCKGKIKEAHALQNNKIISLLAGSERHVYMMNAKKKPLLIPMEKGEPTIIVQMSKTSANDATTETCFCDLHDNIVFAAIEKGAPDFDELNEEMKFIYAYKAFIFEYYKQRTAIDIYKECFKKNPVAFRAPMMVGMYRMLQLKMREFDPIKSHFDKEIMAGTHNGVATCVINIPEQIKFADYAYIAPDYDLNGKKIRHTVKGIMHRLAITVFPESTQSYIILSCLQTERPIYQRLFDQLNAASIDKIKFYISMVLPLYSENMVLSSKLWDSWSEEVKMAYTFYANLTGRDAFVYGKCIGMGIRNAAKKRSEFDYSKRGKIDLFS
ncbi:MAG: SEC-C metal-binding domain-containing protein [Anaerovoracaceae bacterium]